jgi:hypothetical protein
MMPISRTRKTLNYLSSSFRIPGIIFIFSGISKIPDLDSFRCVLGGQWTGYSGIKDLNAF